MNMTYGTGYVLTIVLLAILTLNGMAAASQQITIDNVQTTVGGTGAVSVVLDQAADGISGYTLILQIANPDIARIDSWSPPSWADMTLNGTLPAITMKAQAAALTETKVPSGSKNIPLGSAVIRGVSPGTTPLHISLIHLEDNSGNDYIPSTTIVDGTITVTGRTYRVIPIALPGQSRLPGTPGNDGFCEDLNGDGVVASADVSLYFTNFDWIQNNEPVALFDYNNNGIIDFGDIVTLNEKV